MTDADLIFVGLMATVVGTRVLLFIRPRCSPTIFGFRTHHYMFGVVIGCVGILLKLWLPVSVGLGLAVDEVAFVAIGGNSHLDYWCRRSVIGTAVLCVAMFFMRRWVASMVTG